jgi:hypothetical protein
MKHIISLGAGVQSSTMALMAAHGEITPMPDYAIFADTGWESSEVYRWLDWIETKLPFSVHRVKRVGGNLGELALSVAIKGLDRAGHSLPPFWLAPNGMMPLQCSKEFKTRVIQRFIRESLGLISGQRGPKEVAVTQWLGISRDEAHRMKLCELKYVQNRWPLVDAGLTRSDCLQWMEQNGYPTPPRSSCIFCPYRSPKEWLHLKNNLPADWDAAVRFDKAIRPGYGGLDGAAYVHPQRVPLDEVDFSRQQNQPDLFGNECEGMCGV